MKKKANVTETETPENFISDITEANERITELTGLNATQAGEIANLNTTNETLTTANATLTTGNEALKAEVARLTEANATLTTTNAELEKKANTATSEAQRAIAAANVTAPVPVKDPEKPKSNATGLMRAINAAVAQQTAKG